MRPRVILAAIFLVLFCASCSKKTEGPSFKAEVVDGVKTIRNFRGGSGAGFKPIQFTADLSIGVEEGDEKYMFISPADVDSDRAGDVFVLDSHDAVVKEYDAHGTFLRQFGRQGQGPGEFETPSCLRISDEDEIYVRDYNRIEIFSARGEYRRTLSVAGYSNFDLIDDAALITEKRSSDTSKAERVAVARIDLQSHESREFLNQPVYWPARVMDDEFVYEYPYFFRWGVGSNRRVYAASGVSYSISVFDQGGNLMLRFTKDEAPVPVAGDELKKIEAITTRGSAKAMENPFQARPVYPAFKSISIDQEDRIWVERYQPRWSKFVNKETVFDVFSADGVLLFATRVTGHVYPQLKFKNGYIYALMKNEAGYASAVRVKMKE